MVPVVENQVDLFEFMYPPLLAPKNTLAIIGLIQVNFWMTFIEAKVEIVAVCEFGLVYGYAVAGAVL